MLGGWLAFTDDWALEHKVSFDGRTRRILVHPEVSAIDVKRDLYSAWKEWMMLRDNSQFLPVFRTVGGDPLGGGQYAGDMYFLMNGWKIFVNHAIDFTGILYCEDGSSPFVTEGAHVVRLSVSNLVLAQGSDLLDQVLSEPTGLPPVEPKVAEALMVLYSALRNRVVSRPDGVTYYKADGTPAYKQAVTTVPGSQVTREAPEPAS